ncbi:MAG TPA: hypothetical protein VFS42_06870 [Burkholderiaceae bacterium]|nr:hypothetical protein [Burkholderiaceae bacterium]
MQSGIHLSAPRVADMDRMINYLLSNMDTSRYVVDRERIRAFTEAMISQGWSRVAWHGDQIVGGIGVIEHAIPFAQREQLSVLALQSTVPGVGLMLIRDLVRRVKASPRVLQIVLNFGNGNGAYDVRVHRALSRIAECLPAPQYVLYP